MPFRRPPLRPLSPRVVGSETTTVETPQPVVLLTMWIDVSAGAVPYAAERDARIGMVPVVVWLRAGDA